MMCGSVSVHVCVDAGYKEGEPLGHVRRRWPAHHLGAVLLASFANSPMAEKRLTGRRSTFPPVRPRGHLELRVIDAQPGGDGWIVPLAVTAALFDDREATETACRAVRRAHARSAGARTIPCTRSRPATGSPIPSCVGRPSSASPPHSTPCPGSAPRTWSRALRPSSPGAPRVVGRCPADDMPVTPGATGPGPLNEKNGP